MRDRLSMLTFKYMRKFILKLSLFWVIIIIIDFVLGQVYDTVYANLHKGDYGRNHYICTQVNKDCLVMGSSRAIHHFSPQLIQEKTGMTCYNCGDDGMGIVAMYGRYQLIRERCIPKVIIYDVVAGFDISKDDKTRYIGNLRYYLDNEKVNNLITSIDNTERYKNWMKTYKYNSRFIDITAQRLSNATVTAAEYDYAPLYGIMTYDVESQNVKELSVDTFKMCLFEDLIRTCQKDGTQIIFTISPWYKGTDDSEYAPLFSLCQKYSVPVLNYFKDDEFINAKHLFKNSSHLNEEGATLLCHKVCEAINSIIK